VADNDKIGRVFLIGAGPGDPGLITVHGLELLQECDSVVYDNLVPRELVVGLKPGTRTIYVGKKAGNHALPQDQINQLLVDLAREGDKVARLKGADPLIFGRGGEEARFLKDHDIPYEIVPAVTAAIGASAYTGIPCTDREQASFVTFATGHPAQGKNRPGVPWPKIAQLKNGTLVIYMGVGEVARIVEELIASGMDGDTPAAIIERATLPTQRRLIGVLKDLPQMVISESVRPPALFVIGKVVDLHAGIEWYGSGPLAGKRVMVLRPADQARQVYHDLRRLGAEVMPYPTIATKLHLDSAGWKRFAGLSGDDRWLVVTSENGVRYFIDQLVEVVGDLRRLAPFKIAAIGFGTARALARYHLKADFVPTTATVASLAQELVAKHDLSKAQVVRVQGNLSDDTVASTLTEAGAEVSPLTVYHTFHPTWPDGFKEELESHPPDVIMFSSGSTANGLFGLLTADEIQRITANATIASIGPSTTKVIENLGLKVAVTAKTHSLPGLINELVAHFKSEG
jgi:uroporphyrinogen III methyltransferase/synthase